MLAQQNGAARNPGIESPLPGEKLCAALQTYPLDLRTIADIVREDPALFRQVWRLSMSEESGNDVTNLESAIVAAGRSRLLLYATQGTH
jgi:hypothetical protein